ncbi:MAG: GOLPH3/VPS74 family protein [Streptosporangiaceae bacterium]
MDSLPEDLVLLSLRHGHGRIPHPARLGHALTGAELVQLAERGHVDIRGERVLVTDPTATGDPGLDEALGELVRLGLPPLTRWWIEHPRPEITDGYLGRLARGRVLRHDGSASRWRVADTMRLASAQALLDAIAESAGPITPGEAAFAGLAHAAGLGKLAYPGWGNRGRRRRLAEIARGHWTARTVGRVVGVQAAADAAGEAVAGSVNEAAVNAAVSAANAAARAAEAGMHAAGHDAGGSHMGGAVHH